MEKGKPMRDDNDKEDRTEKEEIPVARIKVRDDKYERMADDAEALVTVRACLYDD
jgi:hypothetical protein